MLARDYLMRQLFLFFQAMTRSWQEKESDDLQAAAKTLEDAIAEATDLDAEALLSLSPDSIAQVLRVSGVDQKVVPYIAHGMLLESRYLAEAGEAALSDVRKSQALALSAAYGFSLPDDPIDIAQANPEGEGLARADGGCGFDDDFGIDDLAALV